MATESDCKFQFAGSPLWTEQNSFAFSKGSSWVEPFSKLIRTYIEDGRLEALNKKWLKDRCNNFEETTLDQPQPFSFSYLSGAWLLMILGVLLSLTVLIVEHIVNLRFYQA